MAQCTSSDATRHFSPAASLAALGVQLRQIDLFGPIRASVKIAQKTVKYAPIDKLYDAFMSILAGAHGLVEINTRLRSDPALQAAFGRSACADQSVVQDTSNACTAAQVTQFSQALTTIYRRHAQGYAHDYTHAWQFLDADLTGMPYWGGCCPRAIMKSWSISWEAARPTCVRNRYHFAHECHLSALHV